MGGSRNGKKICKPKLIDCIGCPENTDYKNSFCSSSKKCTVPYAMVQGGEIIMWLDDVDLPDGWS